MLDIKELRKNRQIIEEKLRTKDASVDLANLMEIDSEIRELITHVEELKSKRNTISKQIGELKRKKENTDSIMQEVSKIGDEISTLDEKISQLHEQFDHEISVLPNIPMDDIKISPDPKDNVTIKEVGHKPNFSFSPKNHLELNESLHLFDFKRGAKMSGSGWPVYKGIGARLEWALINYMLDIHLKNGFTQWIPPLMVRRDMMYGSGQLPKFQGQFYAVPEDDLYLIPTAEIALNALHYDEILSEEELPLKYIAYTPCFRREAGAAGSTERGLIRVHQFNKVEMFCFTKPEESMNIFNQMMDSAEEVLQGLELHYRNCLLVTGDMSFGAARTVDLEIWLPGQNRYYEVSSVSNCTDFQARRSKIRYRPDGGKAELVHTLNGSGLATARLMVGLLENNQTADGNVRIPKVLQPYLGGRELLTPEKP
jgi:seryl-tRNA synthetase